MGFRPSIPASLVWEVCMRWPFFLGGLLASTSSKGSPWPPRGREALSSAPPTSSPARASPLRPCWRLQPAFDRAEAVRHAGLGPAMWVPTVSFSDSAPEMGHFSSETELSPWGVLFSKALEMGTGTSLPQGPCLTPRDGEGSSRS